MVSLSGYFRVTRKEAQLMNELRLRGKPVRCIATTLYRSVSTVDAWTQKVWDNRKQSPSSRKRGLDSWMNQINNLRLKCALFLNGIVKTVGEALDCKSVPLPAITFLNNLSENSTAEEDLDPS